MASRRRGPAALTREQWAEMHDRERRTVEELRRANREMAAELLRLSKEREEVREEVADSEAEALEALSAVIDEYQCYGTPEEVGDERAAMLRAIGVDEYEWDRVKWRYL